MMSFPNNPAIPFKIDEINHGFQEAKGLLKVEEEGLNLEFEVTDALIGLFKSGVKNLFIPYESLNSISYKKGWIGGKIILEATSMKVFDDLPGTEIATGTLKVKRADRKAAESAVSSARLRLSEYRLKEMDQR